MADTLDLVSLGAAQDAIGVTDERTGILANYITTVSRHIDDLCGPVVKRTVTAELHHGGLTALILRKAPVISVTTVTENGTAVAAAGYHLDADAGLLERLGSNYSSWYWQPGRWNISVTYEAGRYDDTGDVDPVFREAAIMAIHGLWNNEQALGGTSTFGPGYGGLDINTDVPIGLSYILPRPAYMLLRPYLARRPGVA